MFLAELGFSFSEPDVPASANDTGIAVAPAAASVTATVDKAVRGLLLHPHTMVKFLETGKSIDVRNFNCRCVKPGDELYLLETGADAAAKNTHGVACVRVVARMRFLENVTIRHEDMHLFADATQISDDEYTAFRSSLKTDKGSCVGWRLELLDILSPSLFLPWGNQAQFVRTI
jgi:hypothetical protein